MQCRHTYGVFQYIYTTSINVVFSIRNDVILMAYSNTYTLRLYMSSFLYAMSSYIWHIPIHIHYVFISLIYSYSTHLVYSSLLLPLTASLRRRPSLSPASHVTCLTVWVFYVSCQVTFCTVIVAVLSSVISGYVLIFG